jgi:hypothetical protein
LSDFHKGELPMSHEAHLSELERKHRLLDQEIQSERQSPGSDDLRLASLKRRKLQLKDEIESLRHRIGTKTVH